MPELGFQRVVSKGSAEAPLRIGLTGGIGSGKSTVSALLEKAGAGLIDADALSRQLTAPGGAAIFALLQAFGPEAMDYDGGLDRAAMRQRVFSDPAAKARLEAILHPLVRSESERRAEALARQCPYLVFDIPLLVESGNARSRVDRVLIIDCPPDIQRARVMQRSGLSSNEVDAIMSRQATRADRLLRADDVLFNDDSLMALEARVDLLHRAYLFAASKLGSNMRGSQA